ncbi:MAG: multidrug efflux SMR transporter [Pseudomonadota bacterium]
MSPWLFLLFAVLLEVAGTFFLKLSDGLARWWWGVASFGCYTACFAVLAPAMKVIPVGVVYAIWAGVGIVAAAIIGLAAFGERLTPVQFFCIALVLIGAVGLRMTTDA